jgi:hypothetical protein
MLHEQFQVSVHDSLGFFVSHDQNATQPNEMFKIKSCRPLSDAVLRFSHLKFGCNFGNESGWYNLKTKVIYWDILRESSYLIYAKAFLIETYSTVRIGKYQSGKFPIQNGLKLGDALSSLRFNFALEYAIRGSRNTKKF